MKWKKISCDFVIITLDSRGWRLGASWRAATPGCAYADYYWNTCGHQGTRHSFVPCSVQLQYVPLEFITSRCRNQEGRVFEWELMNWEMTGRYPRIRTWNNWQAVLLLSEISLSQRVPTQCEAFLRHLTKFRRNLIQKVFVLNPQTRRRTRCCQLGFANF